MKFYEQLCEITARQLDYYIITIDSADKINIRKSS